MPASLPYNAHFAGDQGKVNLFGDASGGELGDVAALLSIGIGLAQLGRASAKAPLQLAGFFGDDEDRTVDRGEIASF